MIATILYLSLSSRTGSLKCGRFIDARSAQGRESGARRKQSRDSVTLLRRERREVGRPNEKDVVGLRDRKRDVSLHHDS